jgi:hypothetical protein
MQVCPGCGITYIDGERHECGPEPHGVALQLPRDWSRQRSLTVFGLLAGLIWSLVPWATFGRFQSLESIPLVLVAGLVTGVAMSFLMERLIRGLRRNGSIVVALATLPIGAFVYGVVTWAVVTAVPELYPGRGPVPAGGPITAGGSFVLGLVMAWPLTVLLMPAAAWTTYQLRGLAEARR